MLQKTLESILIDELVPYARNAKKHSDSQVDQIAASIKEFGFNAPVLVDGENGIIAGHGRVLAAQKLGLKSVPCIRITHLTETQRRAYILADNRLTETGGGWNDSLLKSEIEYLLSQEFSVDLSGFDTADLISMKISLEEKKEEEFSEVSDELEGAMALKFDMKFDSTLPYGIPEIRSDKLGDIPENITTWAGHDASSISDFYFYNWRTDSTKGLDASRSIIGFYTDDARFEAAWETPDKFTSRILNVAPMAIVSPNYSLWANEARAVHIWAAYKSRWVARYFQEAGMLVIPDLNWSDRESLDYSIVGIPKDAPCLSIQLQTSNKNAAEVRAKREVLKIALDALQPRKLFVYANEISEEIMAGLYPSERTIFCANRLQLRQSIMSGKNKKGR